YRAELAKSFTDPRLGPDAPPDQVVAAALQAAKEGNRELFDRLWIADKQVRRQRNQSWFEYRQCFHERASRGTDFDKRTTIDRFKVSPATIVTNFRGEPEATVPASFTNLKG